MSELIARTEQSLVIVRQAVTALESGDVSTGYHLFGEVKQSGISIIKETQYLLDRVRAVEEYYREMEDDKTRKINELYREERVKKQEKHVKSDEIRSKERQLQQADRDLRSAEEDRRDARRRKEEAESNKTANIWGAVGFGLATVATLGLAAPITVPGTVVCTIKAVEASNDDISRARNSISQHESEISQYRSNIRQLDSDIDRLSREIARANSERDRIQTQRGEATQSIKYMRDVLKYWKEFSQLTEHGTHRATLLEKLSALLKVHGDYSSPPSKQLQVCVSAWDKIKEKLEKGNEHVFTIDYTCHVCQNTFRGLPHLHGKRFCCLGCVNM